MFFDQTKLTSDIKVDSELKQEKIIPICLGALNLDKHFNAETEVKQLGWGVIYEESPEPKDNGGIRDPIYSSCMTGQASHYTWRFQNCDMKKMKKSFKKKTTWACEKTLPPPDYRKGQAKICKDYINTANTMENALDRATTLSETRLKDVDIIYVNEGNGRTEECFNTKLLSEFGWCYLKDFKEKHDKIYAWKKGWKNDAAWGICSPSCNVQYMKVRISIYIKWQI